MGFNENDARWALDASAGNIDTAIGLLLDGNLSTIKNNLPATGNEVVTVLNVSQYSFADSGKSACTAIAISVMGVLLEKFSRDEEVHNENELTEAIFSGISNHSKFASDAACHMAVDELAPQLCASLEVVGESIQGLTTNRDAFKDLFASKIKVKSQQSCRFGYNETSRDLVHNITSKKQ